ncbi:MAG: hypothetical protein RI964_2040 [Pseudomonadota bacterium]|jgi:hypothetical protein
MKRNGILWHCGVIIILAACCSSVLAGESADDITSMLTWWEEVGSTWDEAGDMMELTDAESVYLIAENTVEESTYAIEAQ